MLVGEFSFLQGLLTVILRILGKSKRWLTHGGLSPKFSEKIGQKSFPENQAFSGLIEPFQTLSGPFWG